MKKKEDAAKQSANDTSWGKVATWYGEYLDKEGTYQSDVIRPNVLRMLALKPSERMLDLACGQGFFSREFAATGAQVIGCDIAPELIAYAKKSVPNVQFVVTPANDLRFAKDASFDAAACILAIQNIEDMAGVFGEVRRVLVPGGRFVLVLNHPTFRVMKRSSWGWDAEAQVQFRRIDGYLSQSRTQIDMHPGEKKKEHTISYHRSLQDFFKALTKHRLMVTRLEEWTSHKTSERGPRQKAEDLARKEIPLFMALEVRLIPEH